MLIYIAKKLGLFCNMFFLLLTVLLCSVIFVVSYVAFRFFVGRTGFRGSSYGLDNYLHFLFVTLIVPVLLGFLGYYSISKIYSSVNDMSRWLLILLIVVVAIVLYYVSYYFFIMILNYPIRFANAVSTILLSSSLVGIGSGIKRRTK